MERTSHRIFQSFENSELDAEHNCRPAWIANANTGTIGRHLTSNELSVLPAQSKARQHMKSKNRQKFNIIYFKVGDIVTVQLPKKFRNRITRVYAQVIEIPHPLSYQLQTKYAIPSRLYGADVMYYQAHVSQKERLEGELDIADNS